MRNGRKNVSLNEKQPASESKLNSDGERGCAREPRNGRSSHTTGRQRMWVSAHGQKRRKINSDLIKQQPPPHLEANSNGNTQQSTGQKSTNLSAPLQTTAPSSPPPTASPGPRSEVPVTSPSREGRRVPCSPTRCTCHSSMLCSAFPSAGSESVRTPACPPPAAGGRRDPNVPQA